MKRLQLTRDRDFYKGFFSVWSVLVLHNIITLGVNLLDNVMVSAYSESAMAGVSVEFNKIFALDFGYRYFYMFNPGTDIVSDLNPSAHQFRAGARISF